MADKRGLVILPAIFTKMTPRKDKSWKLEIETRELAGEDVRIMADRLGTEGYWLNSPNSDIQAVDIPTTEADSGLEGKTPSQRLRSTLFVLWQQVGEPDDFNRFYATNIEKMIDVVKARLEDK